MEDNLSVGTKFLGFVFASIKSDSGNSGIVDTEKYMDSLARDYYWEGWRAQQFHNDCLSVYMMHLRLQVLKNFPAVQAVDKAQRRTPMLAGNFEFLMQGAKESEDIVWNGSIFRVLVWQCRSLGCGMADKLKGFLLFYKWYHGNWNLS